MDSYFMKSQSTKYINKMLCLDQFSGFSGILIMCFLIIISFNTHAADSGRANTPRTLDTKVQDLKKEVILASIHMQRIQEELISPAHWTLKSRI